MNLLNPWRLSDGPKYSQSSITPFILVSLLTLLLFTISFAIFTVRTAEIRNFEAKSLKRKQKIKKSKSNEELKIKR